MPMHLVADFDGKITHIGPTLAKVLDGTPVLGLRALDVFDLRRPKEDELFEQLYRGSTGKMLLRLRTEDRTQLIGSAVTLPDRAGFLVNLSFGISVFDAVSRFNLAGSDFAPTELTLELLYLAEANAAVMSESRKLTEKLHGAVTQAVVDATTDTLTGLQNRRALDRALARLIDRRTPFTLAHIDLDFFKKVNDTYGHAAGDRVLEEVGRILREETRDVDTVARVGGDEFVVTFAGLTDVKRLSHIATRLISRLEAPIAFDGKQCRISASIGLVSSTQYQVPDGEQMLNDADRALYGCKHAGRAQFRFFNPDQSPAPPRAENASDGS
ncbi:MAG TPA: GGDEF domain-containing protein [Maritimibacter sp.]|nr:GGDEF domain-containing protein [Maritimibacter sp.]